MARAKGENHRKPMEFASSIMVGNLQVNCPCCAGSPSGKCRIRQVGKCIQLGIGPVILENNYAANVETNGL